MDFIDEENTRHNVGFPFFPPLSNFFIDLLSHFLSDLAGGSRKQSQEALRTRVDDVDFVQSDSMDNLFAFFDLSLRTVDEACLRTHSVVVGGPSETATGFADLA